MFPRLLSSCSFLSLDPVYPVYPSHSACSRLTFRESRVIRRGRKRSLSLSLPRFFLFYIRARAKLDSSEAS